MPKGLAIVIGKPSEDEKKEDSEELPGLEELAGKFIGAMKDGDAAAAAEAFRAMHNSCMMDD